MTRPDYCPLWNEPCQKGCDPKCGTLNTWEKLRRENAELRAALNAVKEWDLERTLENLKLTGAVNFKLPQRIREQMQVALTHNAEVSGAGTASAGLPGYAAGGNGEQE